MDFNKLNDKQKEAVLSVDGPLLILAGPGSGKTRVLTYKISYLIENGYAKPWEILAITFTNKAAKEMKDRVYNLIKESDIQISTFHSFGLRILKENYKLLNMDRNFTILDESDSISIIEKILKEMNLDTKQYNPKNIKYKISSCKSELITCEEYSKYSKSGIEEIVQKVYKKYREKLLKTNCLDFDDLLMMPIMLFRDNKEVLEHYQNKYKYVFIDEYQDTNEAQYIMSKMISEKYKNICVVGDECQNIYSWRGANYKNILNFEKDYKNSKVILLEQNYRSTKRILNVANSVIHNNKDRKDKTLFTDNEFGEKVKYITAYDEKDEAVRIANEVSNLKNNVKLSEMVVLYRTNAQSQILERTFVEKQIPYKIIGSYAYYNRKEVKDLVAYLKLINNLKDDTSLLRIINVPKRGIGNKTVEDIINKAREKDTSIFESIEDKKLMEFKEMILDIKKESESKTLTQLVDYIFIKTHIKDEYMSDKIENGDSKIENLEEFKSITKNFERESGNASLEDFLLETSLISDVNENNNDEDRVSLMTIHSVKGLEFEVVFISGLEEGLFPHINSLNEKEGLEEERRLFYVAITRAKKLIYLFNTKMRMIFGRTNISSPSRFISEIDVDDIESNNYEMKSFNRNNMFIDEEIDYKIGDHIEHDVFGKGIVVSVQDEEISIAFSSKYGIKTLMKRHKSIRKSK